MRIALYQCQSQPLDVEGNLERLKARAREAAQWEVELLVLPEMFLSGYNIGAEAARTLAQASDGANAEQVAQIARQFGLAILYGYPELDEQGNVYNAVQLIDRTGARLGNYRKTHLFGDADRAMFSAGTQAPALLEFNGWKLGLLICYDLEFPENARRLAAAGAELILVPTANMVPYGFIAEVTVRSRAFENQCYVAYANYCGKEEEFEYCGLSSIAGADGQQIAKASRDEALIVGTLDKASLASARTAFTYLNDRRPELY
ncbi:carbon-nitrogen hydrolase family protein [Pseudomonas sp. CFBP 8770]|uniref:carbon-nitrogen hydrolase family protein n=1 Tax=unclassified Pseudomonas TaxID=196821 RepID=UPI001780663B|nr:MULTISPECIES: carbon-nitrogen hydrolase family protein [unclassified Pseudomonas]MBD8476159.1 carbon-nitrogen hydrolase family protein [Pseudomonas sp. CFBP 8773]MBD8648941.1 carbon-nitrogen hydrolase family protein [Pseudomonas sp. CFBP 8770]